MITRRMTSHLGTPHRRGGLWRHALHPHVPISRGGESGHLGPQLGKRAFFDLDEGQRTRTQPDRGLVTTRLLPNDLREGGRRGRERLGCAARRGQVGPGRARGESAEPRGGRWCGCGARGGRQDDFLAAHHFTERDGSGFRGHSRVGGWLGSPVEERGVAWCSDVAANSACNLMQLANQRFILSVTRSYQGHEGVGGV